MSTPRVLLTTELSDQNIDLLNSPCFQLDITPFIQIDFRPVSEWKNSIPEKVDAWIFTSKNAVLSIQSLLPELTTPKHCYTVGPKTAELLTPHGIQATYPDVYNAEALGKLILQEDVESVVHFRGNLSASTLTEYLSKAGISVKSIEVYSTLKKYTEAGVPNYDSMIFMSPSAIEAFSSANEIPDGIPVFCIGPTTANAATEYGFQNIIMPEQATIESLSKTLTQYYS